MTEADIQVKHQLEAALAEAADGVERRLAAFFERPDDPETMHKLRVSIRTLRGLLRFAKPFQDKKQNEQANLALRDVVRQTSRLREIDVLIDQVAQIEPEPAPDLVAALEQARADELARVSSFLARKKARKLLREARVASRAVAWRSSDVAWVGLTTDQVQQRFDALLQAELARLESLDRADTEATHEARKKAKEVRYCAERLGKLLSPEAQEVGERMKAVQDDLGALCDARVNLQIVEGFSREGLSARACADLDSLAQRNRVAIEAAISG